MITLSLIVPIRQSSYGFYGTKIRVKVSIRWEKKITKNTYFPSLTSQFLDQNAPYSWPTAADGHPPPPTGQPAYWTGKTGSRHSSAVLHWQLDQPITDPLSGRSISLLIGRNWFETSKFSTISPNSRRTNKIVFYLCGSLLLSPYILDITNYIYCMFFFMKERIAKTCVTLAIYAI